MTQKIEAEKPNSFWRLNAISPRKERKVFQTEFINHIQAENGVSLGIGFTTFQDYVFF